MDFEKIISQKFPKHNVEVITRDMFNLDDLVEYITDDIIVSKPLTIMVYRHFIRFIMSHGGKIYYLDSFSDEDLKVIHGGLLKFTWKNDVKINLFKYSNPESEILGL